MDGYGMKWYNGLNDKNLEGALHHVNMAGPQCQEFNTDFIQ